MHARGVDEDVLSSISGENAVHRLAGGSRLRADDCEGLPHDCVHQGALSDVGPTDEGDVARAGRARWEWSAHPSPRILGAWE